MVRRCGVLMHSVGARLFDGLLISLVFCSPPPIVSYIGFCFYSTKWQRAKRLHALYCRAPTSLIQAYPMSSFVNATLAFGQRLMFLATCASLSLMSIFNEQIDSSTQARCLDMTKPNTRYAKPSDVVISPPVGILF